MVTERADAKQGKTEPEVIMQAMKIAHDPQLFLKCISDVQSLGVIKERRNIGITKCTIDSRLLPGEPKKSDTLGIKIYGPKGSGKSNIVFRTMNFYSNRTFVLVTSGSDMSIVYESNLVNKTIVMTEALPLESKGGKDTPYAYKMRTLLSENFVNHKTTIAVKGGGRQTITVKMVGPTSLLTTTTSNNFEPQLNDRLLTTSPEKNAEKTNSILSMSAKRAAGKLNQTDAMLISAYQHYHDSLEAYTVIIPFSEKISGYLIKYTGFDDDIHRAFNRVLSMVRAVTIAYQFQRKTDKNGCLIAEESDYAIAQQLIDKPFREQLGLEQFINDRIRYIDKHGPMKPKDIAEAFDVSGPAVTQWMKPWIKKGLLVWVDQDGNQFPDEKALKKAKPAGKAFIAVGGITGLPTPFQLTGDPRWDIGGDLYEKYDLKLDDEDIDLTIPESDIPRSSEKQKPTESKVNSNTVNALGSKSHAEVKKMMRESRPDPVFIPDDDPETLNLAEDIGFFLDFKTVDNHQSHKNDNLSEREEYLKLGIIPCD